MQSKYLLVTSDDFGMCHSINAGTARAMQTGIVRSTNFLVPCPWFPEALALAQRLGLAAGVHLCLTSEWDHLRWRPLTAARSLSDESGYLHPSYEALAPRAREEDVVAELEAQIALVKQLGYQPTHLDSHMLAGGVYPGFAGLVKDITHGLARKHGLIYTYDASPAGLLHFRAEWCISPQPEADTWRTLESWMEPGVYHLIGHAAEASIELEALCSDHYGARPWASEYRLRDMAFFTSAAVRSRIEQLGFEIIGMAELLRLRAANALDPAPGLGA